MLGLRHTAGLVALVSLAACGPASTPERNAVDANAAVMEAGLANLADQYEAEANNAADANAADAMRNAADGLDDLKDNVADAADAHLDNLQ